MKSKWMALAGAIALAAGTAGATVIAQWTFEGDVLTPEAELLSRVEHLPLFRRSDGRPRRVDPESVALVRFAGRVLAVASLEQSDAVIVVDVSAPRAPVVVGHYPTGRRPEGLIVVPDGENLLALTGDEGSGEITFGRIRAEP